ncbi:hypothetical protein GCM10027278_02510 [Paralcaligenes ginsengisoli]
MTALPLTNVESAACGPTDIHPTIPDDLITFRISVLSQLLARVVNNSVSQSQGLSSRQWRLLVTLSRLGRPSSSGEIAQFSHLDYSQVSRAGYELSQKGLVTYTADKKDRRKSFLHLSAEGERVLAAGLSGTLNRQERLRGVMTQEEYRFLDKAIRALTLEAQSMLDETKSDDAEADG